MLELLIVVAVVLTISAIAIPILGHPRSCFQLKLVRADFGARNDAALAPNDNDVTYPLIL